MGKWWIVWFTFIIAVSVFMGWVISLPWPHEDAEHKLCDKQVPILITSKDLVDVVRAGIIVYQLNCGIGRRLPKE